MPLATDNTASPMIMIIITPPAEDVLFLPSPSGTSNRMWPSPFVLTGVASGSGVGVGSPVCAADSVLSAVSASPVAYAAGSDEAAIVDVAFAVRSDVDVVLAVGLSVSAAFTVGTGDAVGLDVGTGDAVGLGVGSDVDVAFAVWPCVAVAGSSVGAVVAAGGSVGSGVTTGVPVVAGVAVLLSLEALALSVAGSKGIRSVSLESPDTAMPIIAHDNTIAAITIVIHAVFALFQLTFCFCG